MHRGRKSQGRAHRDKTRQAAVSHATGDLAAILADLNRRKRMTTSPTDTDGWTEWWPRLLRRLRRSRQRSLRTPIVPPCMLVVLVYAGLWVFLHLFFWLALNSWAWNVTWRSPAIGRLSLIHAFIAVNIMMTVYVLLSLVGFVQGRMRKRPALWCGYACSLVMLGLLQWYFCGMYKLTRNWADLFRDNPAWYRLPRLPGWDEDIPIRVSHYLRTGEDPGETLPHGRSLLHYGTIVAYSDGRLYERLLKAEPDVNVRDAFGRTPLHYTTEALQLRPYWFRAEVMRIVAGKLIQHGADVNAKDSEELTPLHYAVVVHAYYNRLAQLLIANGADVNAADNLGRTPLHYAAKHHCHQDERYLTESGAVVAVPDPRYVKSTLEILLEQGANPNARDVYGRTPLYFAELSWSTDSAKALLRKYGGTE